METDTRREKHMRITVVILSILLAGMVIIPVIRTAFTSYKGLVLDNEGSYFLARNIHICGETLICRKSSFTSKKKGAALSDETGTFSLSILPVNNIKSIEFIPDEEDPEDGDLNAAYLGRYKINVQGHDGTLVLYEKNGRVYGTVRFRTWANGATEYLKGIKISGKTIRFTRSATTLKEMRRLGANNLFTQRFYGTYSASGKKIYGHFTNDRKEKYEWKAVK